VVAREVRALDLLARPRVDYAANSNNDIPG
jgi:hypothetical protein